MLEEQNAIDVYESRSFTKSLKKLPKSQIKIIEDEIDRIIENPEIGELKKGNLSYLSVHKFKMDSLLVLLGYAWLEDKLEIYLLSFGSHENFYKKMQTKRSTDIKFIKS